MRVWRGRRTRHAQSGESMFGISRFIKERFPDRTIYHRSDGHVQYFALSTEMQVGALLVACAVSTWLTWSTVNMLLAVRAQAALERSAISDVNADLGSTLPHSIDNEISLIEEMLSNINSTIGEARSQLERERRDLQVARAEHERLRRIIALSEEDAQTAIEIFRLENERNALSRRMENALFALAGILVTVIFGCLALIRGKSRLGGE